MKAATNNYVFTDIIENISIHAAREGGDSINGKCPAMRFISIHAAREGGDLWTLSSATLRAIFQSTPPVKAATSSAYFNDGKLYISIHAAREGGDVAAVLSAAFHFISIHAAREGGDLIPCVQPRGICISIHAAREGGDADP